MHLVAVGAFAMKDRSSLAAAQQLFADTASALVANLQHKQSSFAGDRVRFRRLSSKRAAAGTFHRYQPGFPFWVVIQHRTNTKRSTNASSSPNWSAKRFPRCRNWPVLPHAVTQRPKMPFFQSIPQTVLLPSILPRHRNPLRLAGRLSRGRWQRRDPPQHASKEPARQMALRK